jgi:hypothetical protein
MLLLFVFVYTTKLATKAGEAYSKSKAIIMKIKEARKLCSGLV